MKKAFIAIIFVFISFSLFAAYKHELSKPLSLQAGYGTVTKVNITEISSSNDPEFRIGMPFNIEDGSVNVSDAQNGRIIANWDFVSNTPFSLKIDAKPLAHEKNTSVTLSYNLALDFTLSYASGTARDSKAGCFTYSNGETKLLNENNDNIGQPDTEGYVSISYLLNGSAETNGFIGSASGYIRLSFTDEAKTKIENAPAGQYSGEVTIHIKTV